MASTKKEAVNDLITIKVYAHKVKTEDDTFMAYKTKIGELNMDVKLTKECDNEDFTNLSDGESAYIKLKVKDVSLDTRKKYPVLWVRK